MMVFLNRMEQLISFSYTFEYFYIDLIYVLVEILTQGYLHTERIEDFFSFLSRANRKSLLLLEDSSLFNYDLHYFGLNI
jgi:hypothetical protein